MNQPVSEDGPRGSGRHKPRLGGQLLLSGGQLLPRGNVGPVSPAQLVFPQKLEIKILCMKSLHLKNCQLIQIFKQRYMRQQMCRPNQIRVWAWAGPGPTRRDILLSSVNSLRISTRSPLQTTPSQLSRSLYISWGKTSKKVAHLQIRNKKTCHSTQHYRSK